MKIILSILLCLIFPAFAFADSSVAFFTPPSSDYSVIFLGNLFGIVDGVLHGSGSQMMGKLFLVFNSAVLALGGIIVTYTLVVGTMNTAHEGQFLGQKWSSIWIPVRSTIGLALLIPKASGYCLMQIFIMWMVVQGVGAADRVWDAALDYLNLGGVFMAAQAPLNPTSADSTAVEQMATGESAILQGQVCMRGIQMVLDNARTEYLTQKEAGGGPCWEKNPNYDSNWAQFCTSSVPDFVSTVNAVEAGAMDANQVTMPNFTDGSMYQSFNGICGKIVWTKLDMASETSNLDYVSAEEVETLNQSRPIAVNQMYIDLMSTSMGMVNNDPEIKNNPNSDVSKRYSAIAQDQYGVPFLTTTQTTCTKASTDCGAWGPASGGNTQSYIFSGFEFINALNDYNAIMLPVLNLMVQNDDAEASNQAHEFIDDAHAVGWSMAGAYFFDMTALNGNAAGGTNEVDTSSGLEASVPFSGSLLLGAFSGADCVGQYALLCTFLNKNSAQVTAINNLITGESVKSGMTANVGSSGHTAILDVGSASTYGYITNGSMVHLPGQPGLTTPTFEFNLNIVPGETLLEIPHVNFSCGIKVFILECLWKGLGDILWNTIIKQFFTLIINYISTLFDFTIQHLLVLPLITMMTILNNGVQLLNTSQTHPIVALAYMGTGFINYVTSLYFQLIALSAVFSMFGGAMILMFILPFLAAWMGVMITIGFIDAYYVPFLPYMMFTFGVVAWLLAVTEAMVAGPIVGLGITHPEGHDALGKAEHAFLILINVFLRPSMMILGYIAGITLSYVTVYTINAGFDHFMQFFMPENTAKTPYTNYAAMYAGFFCLLVYTSIYLTVVEKSFTLIYLLPDQILRWIGGQPEQFGKETAQWVEPTKKQVEEGGKTTAQAGKDTTTQFGDKVVSSLGATKTKGPKGEIDKQ